MDRQCQLMATATKNGTRVLQYVLPTTDVGFSFLGSLRISGLMYYVIDDGKQRIYAGEVSAHI